MMRLFAVVWFKWSGIVVVLLEIREVWRTEAWIYIGLKVAHISCQVLACLLSPVPHVASREVIPTLTKRSGQDKTRLLRALEN